MGRSRRRYARQRRVEKQNDDPSLMRVTPASRLDHSRARARAFLSERGKKWIIFSSPSPARLPSDDYCCAASVWSFFWSSWISLCLVSCLDSMLFTILSNRSLRDETSGSGVGPSDAGRGADGRAAGQPPHLRQDETGPARGSAQDLLLSGLPYVWNALQVKHFCTITTPSTHISMESSCQVEFNEPTFWT